MAVGDNVLTWTNDDTIALRNVSLGTGYVHWQTRSRRFNTYTNGSWQVYVPVVGRDTLLVSTIHGTQVLRRRDGALLWNTTSQPFDPDTYGFEDGGSSSATVAGEDAFLFAGKHFTNSTRFAVRIDFLSQAWSTPTDGGPAGSSYFWHFMGFGIAVFVAVVVLLAVAVVRHRRRWPSSVTSALDEGEPLNRADYGENGFEWTGAQSRAGNNDQIRMDYE
jgi:hypothetical protein